jgi:hypothetical protein
MTAMPKQTRNKFVVSYTLDPDVIEKIDTLADSLGVSSSALVNLQLRIALGMVDDETHNFIDRGRTTARLTDIGLEEK